MASAKRRKKASKKAAPSPQQRAAETRRQNRAAEERREKARARRARAAARKGAETRARKRREAEEKHRRRVEAAKRGYAKKLVKDRTRGALETWLDHANERTPGGRFKHETRVLHEQWLQSKRELLSSLGGDYEAYLELLEELAEETGTEWDIAYGGSTESAA